jgi:enoyl-CoA hydratase
VQGAAAAMGGIQFAVHRGKESTLDEGLRIEQEAVESVLRSEEAWEGIRAFVEKRGTKFVD